MLGDFSFTSSRDILKGLEGKKSTMKGKSQENMSGSKPMSMSEQKESLIVEQWDAASKRLIAQNVQAVPPDIDVKYDALLANRRTIDDPQVFEVRPRQSVLLRFIGAAAATNFFIDTGKLDATIIATDGEDVQPLKGNFFQLSTAQRLDLLIIIPQTGGVFPVLALAEGSTLQAGVLLATPGAKIPKGTFPIRAQQKMGGLDNTQEIRLVAKDPLPERPVQRSLPSVLGGDMITYTWTINGTPYPNRNSLNVKENERVELVISNKPECPIPCIYMDMFSKLLKSTVKKSQAQSATPSLFYRNPQSKLPLMPTIPGCGLVTATSSIILRQGCSPF
jgi:FtsP/CotA-like multicopper oxidase with cupredoxin domain